jgi:hypothetical protein
MQPVSPNTLPNYAPPPECIFRVGGKHFYIHEQCLSEPHICGSLLDVNSIQERFKSEPIHSLTTDPRLFKIYVIPYIYHRTVPKWDDVENPQALLDAANYLQLMDFVKQFELKRMPRAKPAPNFIEFAPEPTTFPEHKITFKLTPDYRFTYRPKSCGATFLEEHVNYPKLRSYLIVSSSTTIGKIKEKMLRTCLKFYHPDKEVYSNRLKFRKLKIIQRASTTLLGNKQNKKLGDYGIDPPFEFEVCLKGKLCLSN